MFSKAFFSSNMVQVMDTEPSHTECQLCTRLTVSVIGFAPSLEKMQEEMWREESCEVYK